MGKPTGGPTKILCKNIGNFFFADFDVSSYLKIEIFLENFWICFCRLVGRWVEWGSGWAALGSSWTEAGLKLGVGSSRTWLKLSWISVGMGWAEAQAGLILAELKLGLLPAHPL